MKSSIQVVVLEIKGAQDGTVPWCCKSIEEEFLSIGCDLQKTMSGEGKLEEDHSESSGRHRDIQDMEHCRSMLE